MTVSAEVQGAGYRAPRARFIWSIRELEVPASPLESAYFKRLHQAKPEAVAPLRAFLAGLEDTGITPEFQKAVVLRFLLPNGQRASAGGIWARGIAPLCDAYYFAEKNGCTEVGLRYLNAVAALVGGEARRSASGYVDVTTPNGFNVSIVALLDHADAWKALLAIFVQELRAVVSA